MDLPDRAELPGQYHLARLAYHRVGGKSVGDAEDEAARPCPFGEVERISERRGQRLVADHVDALVEERAGDRVMKVVGRGDGNRLDPVRAAGLAFSHLVEVRIRALGRYPPLPSRRLGTFRIRRQCAGHHLPAITKAGSHGVDLAYESALAATDHPETQSPAR